MKAAAAALLVLALAAPAGAAGRPPPLADVFGGPFELVDHEGRARTDRDFLGTFLLVHFGYLHCPAICPTNLSRMADALRRLGPAAARIQPLFVTVDPARDTPAALGAYLAHFGERFVGLTGTEARIRDVAARYRVHRRKVRVAGADAGDPDAYLVDHGTLTYLMGPDGRLVTLFPHDTPGEVMARRIRRHLDAAPR